MIKTGAFTIVAICAAMVLSSISMIHAIGGKIGGPVLPNGVGNVYLKDATVRAKVGLAEIDWTTSTDRIGLGYTKWKNQDAFVKCVPSSNKLTVETRAFDILDGFKTKERHIPGSNDIAQPLARFDIPKKLWKIEANCFVYELVPGDTLEKFAIGKSWQEKARYLPQLFKQAMLGMLYLRRVGIIHNDIAPKNIVAGFNSKNEILLKASSYEQVTACNDNNRNLGLSIYYAITEAFPGGGIDDPVEDSLKALEYNIKAAAANKPLTLGQRYRDMLNKVPQYPTHGDEQYAIALLPLVHAMVLLTSSKYDNCAIANDVLALLGITNFK
ncbi:hypothetical protein BDF19DRAFT_411716 [Syncephalis fuscata]|nr:hypothetical protein BDF19DRAFT_411716 [Syncephalis fuscata]